MPASPTSGGERGGVELFKPVEQNADMKRLGIEAKPGRLINQKFDFIHQKELNVLLSWLMTHPSVSQFWEIVDRAPIETDVKLQSADMLIDPDYLFRPMRIRELQVFSDAIASRIKSLDAM